METAYVNSALQEPTWAPTQFDLVQIVDALNGKGHFSPKAFAVWWPTWVACMYGGVRASDDVGPWRMRKLVRLKSIRAPDMAELSRALRMSQRLQSRFSAHLEDLGSAQGVAQRRLRQHVDAWLANRRDLGGYLKGAPERVGRTIRSVLNEMLAQELKRRDSASEWDEATLKFILQIKPRNQSMRRFLGEVLASSRGRRRLDRPAVEAEHTADRLFAILVSSPRSADVGRCRRVACGRYFVGRPKKRQKQYCSDLCRTVESSKRSAKERRKKEKAEKLRRVKDAYTKWNAKPRRGNDSKRWIVNSARVSLTWLTRALNRKEVIPPQLGRPRKENQTKMRRNHGND